MEQLKLLSNGFWQVTRSRKLPLETDVAWFVLASFLDFCMTYILLNQPDSHFIESNPIAVYFLNHWGVRGLLFFKLSIVTFVVLVCLTIAGQNLRLGRRVLHFGTLIVGAVVVYSVYLHQTAGGPMILAG